LSVSDPGEIGPRSTALGHSGRLATGRHRGSTETAGHVGVAGRSGGPDDAGPLGVADRDGFAGCESARAVADAVLYEGYLLYPYRRSSGKNRVRWQFGVLAPRA